MNYRSSKLYKQNRSLNTKFKESNIFYICQIKPISCADQINLRKEVKKIDVSLNYLQNQSIKLLPAFSKLNNPSFYNIFQGNISIFYMNMENHFLKLKLLNKIIQKNQITILGVLINNRLICPSFINNLIELDIKSIQQGLVNSMLKKAELQFYNQIKTNSERFINHLQDPKYQIIRVLNILHLKKQYERPI